MPKVTVSKTFTGTTIFSGANFTSTSGYTVSAGVQISRYDEITFFATLNNTGAAGLAATVTAQVSYDGTTYFDYGGLLVDGNTSHTGSSQVTLNTGGSEIFSLRNMGAIHSVRFSLGMAGQIASTSFSLFYTAITEDA